MNPRGYTRFWFLALVVGLLLASVGELPAQTPAGRWSFDAGSGSSASDTSGNGHTATLSGATWTSSARVGPNALQLVQSSSQFAATTGPVVNTSASFTAAVWVKLSSLAGTAQTFVSIDGTNISGFYLQYQQTAGRIIFGIRSSDSVFAALTEAVGLAAPSTGTWYHVAGVYNATAGTMSLYINGTLQQSVAFSSAWQATGATAIGRGRWNGANVDYVDGVIDEARLYTSALNSTQIQALYSGSATIRGTVFEDVGYGGGAGRSQAASGGSSRSGTRVELYYADGAYAAATTTDGTGAYAFSALPVYTSYTVRAVNSTVTSSLGGSSLCPVQTFRTTATSGTAVAVTDRVGGENPAKADAGNGSSTLAALTAGSLTPQSITAVAVADSVLTGVDFGYNFNTVVNTNDTAQGSLRQFVTNANAMSGTQTSVFMITDGSSHAGLRAGLTNQLTGGVAIITPATALPAISGALALDGTSQTSNVGNTNSGTLGTGGTVGVDGISLSTVNRPEVEIVGNGSINNGLDITAAGTSIVGLSIHGFGSAHIHGDITVAANSVTISSCVIGATATSFSLPGSATSEGNAIYVASGSGGSVSNNLLGFTGHSGLRMEDSGPTSWTISGNEVRGTGRFETARPGVTLRGYSHTVSGNLIAACKGAGISFPPTGGSSLAQNNTITGGGVGTAGTIQDSGMLVSSSGHTIDRNKIYGYRGSGIIVTQAASGVKITRNSIYNNGTILNDASAPVTGGIGIDLLVAAENVHQGAAPYYTLNDDGDGDSGGNGGLNFPVLDTATIVGSNLRISGWAPTGATLEFFVSDSDPSGFGEGQTYIGSLVEGGGSDTDVTSSSYSGTVNGIAQGSGTGVQRFTFTVARPGGVSNGAKLTATATDGSNNTSEFSGQVTVASLYPSFTVVTSSQTYSDPVNATTLPKAIPGSFMLNSIVTTNSSAAPSDNDSFLVSIAVPAGSDLYVGDLGGVGSGPVSFTDGTTSCALTYTFTSLASTTDDVEFSNDGGTTWTYSPTADSDGCDTHVTHLRVNPKGAFAAAAGGNNPSCTVSFRIRVE